jgi:putative membrane protein insertion efficiency factor
MSDVRKQSPSGQRRLSTLRKSLNKARLWLAIAGLLSVALIVDLNRDPPSQVTARLYVITVRGYQAFVSPHLHGFVRCRYCPSCSEYSIQAVENYGLGKGLKMTASRICRCTSDVPAGTRDPVPVTNCKQSKAPASTN